MPAPPASTIEQTLLDLITSRRDGASICPSEVARQLASTEGAWRELMPAVRDAARRLAHVGRVEVTQRGHVLSPDDVWQGAIRIRQRET